MNAVVAWLESAEGLAWGRSVMIRPRDGHLSLPQPLHPFAHLLPDPGLEGAPCWPQGGVDPAHDPCGRPVLRETR